MSFKKIIYQPWYILLLTLFFVLHGVTENFFLVPLQDAFFLILIYLGATVILVFILWIYTRRIQKAVFLSFLLLAFNFFFGYLHDGLKTLFPGTVASKYGVVLSSAAAIFLIIATGLKRIGRFPMRLILYLNILFCLFILTDTVILAKKIYSVKHEATDEMMMPDSAFRKKKLPDVYLIVADEYAGIKNLADVCGFDNSPFYDSLRMRNFFVASHSRSNYNYTTYSIASLLNMEYLPLNKSR